MPIPKSVTRDARRARNLGYPEYARAWMAVLGSEPKALDDHPDASLLMHAAASVFGGRQALAQEQARWAPWQPAPGLTA